MATIVLWLGGAFETWDPKTVIDGTGIGGSETAAIRMSQELAKLGHTVTVFADVPAAFVESFGTGFVSWVPYRTALVDRDKRKNIECDLFISSRVAEARFRLKPVCKQAWLWMHDLHCGPDWENLVGGTHDRILCLSSWARKKFIDTYPGVEEQKVVQTRNGIDLERFVHDDLKPGQQHDRLRAGVQPLTVVYSSSPDRGLDRLLDMWPEISSLAQQHSASDAVLHVYYGFEGWKKLAAVQGNSYIDGQRIAALETRVARTSGVVFHGRVNQRELARAFLNAQLWLYPTSFPEVSCITAMEAQAAGCKIVATEFAALPGTAPYARFVEPPAGTAKYAREFIEAVRASLNDPQCYVGGKDLWTWAQVARQWQEWIADL